MRNRFSVFIRSTSFPRIAVSDQPVSPRVDEA
jgi:hypothetical protein